jgi:GNAT superfamily N-acetyltransferase
VEASSFEIRLARPDEEDACWEIEGECWPDFHAEQIENDFYDPELHVVAVSTDGTVLATGNAVPLAWDGDPAHLPAGGWAEVQHGWVAECESGAPVDARESARFASAVGISVRPGLQGGGIGAAMLAGLRGAAADAGYAALVAPVRPSAKFLMPDMSYAEYAQVRLATGEHFDPWIRLHERAGGRIVGVCERSFTMNGSHAEWQEWTGLKLPKQGRLLIKGGNGYLELANGSGLMVEGSIWLLHDLA